MIATGYAGYRNAMSNTTESKEEILLMLYEGALISLKIARRGIREKNLKLKGEKISKVLAILTELDCALDRKKGGELAENMAGIYRYLINRLTTANIKNDPEALEEVERLLGELYEGFKEIARREVPIVYTKNTEPEMRGEVSIAI
ncbi:MAG: flagellar export chaperone FliS [Thermodesulfobacteriota bacterium]|nr:flagellar export chaperone FliS [Thermodesulfobacteriota bacterium]